MSLINCPECKHPMSDKAKACPNCHAPRNIGAVKEKTESNKKPMATTKKTSASFSVLPLLTLILGASGMYILMLFLTPQTTLTSEYATVQRINGLYVFVESNPAINYKVIRIIEGKDFIEVFNDFGIGKKKFGEVLQNMVQAGMDQNFHRKIELMAEKAKAENPGAEGIIFHGKMNRCEVIKF